jgi:hypothetical protein
MKALTIDFKPFKEGDKIEEMKRCFIVDSDGFIDIALFTGGKWINEGSYVYDGGYSGTEEDVVGYSYIDLI